MKSKKTLEYFFSVFWNILRDPRKKKAVVVVELLSTPLNSNLIQQTQPVVDVTLLWFLVKTHCSISSPPGAAPRQPQCEGLWVFSPLRVKDYGWLTAFVWRGKKKERKHRCATCWSLCEQQRLPRKPRLLFDVLLSGAGASQSGAAQSLGCWRGDSHHWPATRHRDQTLTCRLFIQVSATSAFVLRTRT